MASIVIVNFTFNFAFWALLDGGVLVGTLLFFWIVKRYIKNKGDINASKYHF